MSNPFENPDASYHALVNDEGQYSLWPTSITIPEGWAAAFGPDSRTACLDFIEDNWTDMRPRSLRAAMENRPGMAGIGHGTASLDVCGPTGKEGKC